MTDSLFCLLACCTFFQATLLRRSTPILVRGAIVLGDIYAQGDIIFGPGLTQAYLLEENSAKYPRILITKETLDSSFDNISCSSFKNNIDEIVFCDNDKYYASNWMNTMFSFTSSNDNDSPIIRMKKLSEHVQFILNCTTDFSIREKYLYLDEKLSYYKQKMGIEQL